MASKRNSLPLYTATTAKPCSFMTHSEIGTLLPILVKATRFDMETSRLGLVECPAAYIKKRIWLNCVTDDVVLYYAPDAKADKCRIMFLTRQEKYGPLIKRLVKLFAHLTPLKSSTSKARKSK